MQLVGEVLPLFIPFSASSHGTTSSKLRSHMVGPCTTCVMIPRTKFCWISSWRLARTILTDSCGESLARTPYLLSRMNVGTLYVLWWTLHEHVDKSIWQTLTKTQENPILTDQLVVMSEHTDITEAFLKHQAFRPVLQALKDPKVLKHFRSLSVCFDLLHLVIVEYLKSPPDYGPNDSTTNKRTREPSVQATPRLSVLEHPKSFTTNRDTTACESGVQLHRPP